ncbi:FMN-binding protein [Fulvivirga ligni]|uniref:FMN-binding protein n=1 Tax=Fulvivirga ligni TaxID=2904246 RepID=UPI001F212ACC|nr:FMN-binding protein [Fulvivirga ligni]UII19611.1 FMN-binding protein [Fulvivirga ligni]
MSKTTFFLIFVFFNLAGNKIIAQHQINVDQLALELGKMIDDNYNDQKDLDSLISFKVLDGTNVRTIKKDDALTIYYENIDNEARELLPIFEIKHSSKVILPVYGEGQWGKIWAKVVIDKSTMKILDIKFEHRNEAPTFGSKITSETFKANFINKKIYFKEGFSLYQNDQLVLKGAQRVDGISGATLTSKGVVNMLNEGLSDYEVYLR